MPKWKPVSIDNIPIKNLEGLVGIEVLDDFEDVKIVRDGNQVRKKKGKKRKIACEQIEKETVDLNKGEEKEIVDINEGERPSSPGKYVRIHDTNSVEDDTNWLKDMEAWKKHGIKRVILKALHDKGFFKPTKIQEKCVHASVTSKTSDIVGAAVTGSGKTYAFGIPVVQSILQLKEAKMENQPDAEDDELFAMVITPTRELAVQVKDHLMNLCKYTKIRIALVVGGLAKEKQERLLKRRPEIIVGTPGRIWELYNEGNPHLLNLPRIRMLVVDEADRMLERQHFAELGEILEKMNENPDFRAKRRNFVFSATLTVVHDPPNYHAGKKQKPKAKLRELFARIGVTKEIVYDLSVEKFTPETLSEWKVNCHLDEKDYYLVYFLQNNPGRCIIFCNSIGCVRRLTTLLTLLNLRPYPLHASMDQKRRLQNLEKFRDTEDSILLATDVAARGLDIPLVGHVVHYQVPRTAESYVHRSGRTARGSNTGASLLLVSVEERKLHNKLMKTLKRDSGIDDLVVPPSELSNIMKAVYVARDIDKLTLAIKRTTSKEKWFEKAANEMDLLLDDDEIPEKTSDFAMKKLKKDVTQKQAELKRLLQLTSIPQRFSRNFPDLNVNYKPKKMRKLHV